MKLHTQLSAGIPAPSDVIALTIDGDQVFSAPLSSFTPKNAPGMPTKYRLKANNQFIELDFAKRSFLVVSKTLLPNLDVTNGVEVVLKFNANAAVDNVTAKDHKGDRHYRFK